MLSHLESKVYTHEELNHDDQVRSNGQAMPGAYALWDDLACKPCSNSR